MSNRPPGAQTSAVDACRRFLQEILLLEEGESLLLYTDAGSDRRLVTGLAGAGASLGVDVEELDLVGFATLEHRIAALRGAISRGNHDVLCELSRQYFYPSGIWEECVRAGRRVYSAAGIDVDVFRRCISNVDQQALREMGNALGALLVSAGTIRVTTPPGTCLEARMQPSGVYETVLCALAGSMFGRALRKAGIDQRPIIWAATGFPQRRGGATFMGGQLSLTAIPRSLNGLAVVDGYQWPPAELGRLPRPLQLEVRRGCVTSIEDSPALSRWLQDRDTAVEHLCFGFNPGAGLDGSLTEAERAYGHVNLGFGRYPFHTDGVMRQPTVWFDDELILENHRYIHPDLVEIEQWLL